MRIFYSLNDFLKSKIRFKKFIITIGVFDGVHSAHKKLIRFLIKRAKKRRLSTLLITFDPHPVNVLNKAGRVPLLISFKHRLRLLQEAGLDYVIALRFDKRLSNVSAANFIKRILGKIYIDEIIVGKNFFFGKNRKGTLADLKRFSKVCGYRVNIVGTLKSSNRIISSTWIRSLILKGDLKGASKLLSRPVAILGTVVTGHKRGRIIGFPTANINPHHEAIPPSGVYAVKIRLENKLYKGILNIGIRPTFRKGSYSEEKEPTIEAHIFNFDKSIYNKDLEIIFVEKIRNEKIFSDADSLKRQIVEDEKRAKRILS